MNKSIYIPLLLLGFIFSSCEPKEESEGTEKFVDIKDTNDDETELIATEVQEPITVKADFLAKLEGEHTLEYISGFLGANTMVDYELLDENWRANGSSNNGGVREGYDIELSEEDLQKLTSMKVIVAADLSISVVCKGKTYYSIPFKEDRLTYLLKKSPEDFIMGVPNDLEETTTFSKGYLYLYARDEIPESEITPIDIAGAFADAAVLKCDSTTGEFELNLFYGDCCDHSTYVFN